MTQITRVPKGLQDLLGTKQLGKNPGELAQSVIPQLDLFPFYAAERLTWKRTNSPVSAAGNGPGFTIPVGEIWIPVGMSLQFNAGTAVDFMVGATIEEAPGTETPTVPIEIFGTEKQTAALSDLWTYAFWWPQHVVLQSDTIIRSQVNELSVGAPVSFLEFQLWFYRFTV